MLCPSCATDNPPDGEVCFSCGRHLTALTHGSVIASRYEIVSLLGKGGMGMVYKANDRLLEEQVAIKVLRNEFVGTSEMAQRFRSEIKLARKVSHPNVCRIHEYGEDGGVSYISMALIEGIDLRKLLLQHPEGMPRNDAFQVAIQVADGLQAIHDVGVIHRDLKTPNIVIDAGGLVRLMDFGIAKESGHGGGLTATGEVMGTPEYMSPEQCRGGTLDFRSDVYSLGIVVYEVFTGHVPFRGDSLMATLLKQLQDPPPLDGPEAASIPPGVARALRKALAKEPDLRFGTAAEVAHALREARKEPAPVVLDAPAARKPWTSEERRKHSRLDISVDVVLKRISAGGAVLQEERTVADNIGRRGARVMTAMTGLNAGDTMVLQEVGSDFLARAAVRYVFKPVDNIQRLGLEFLDRAAPDRLVPTDADSKSRIPRVRRAEAAAATPTPASSPTPASAAAADRRRDSRLEISVDVILKRIGPGGVVLQQERTVADNVGRHGARVLTAMTGLKVGDLVAFEEVGSDFSTRAAVRSSFTGKDNIHRLGVEFLGRSAPDHLVGRDPSEPRTPRPPVSRIERPVEPPSPTPGPLPRAADTGRLRERRLQILDAYEGIKQRSHFEVLGIPRASSAAQVREAYVRLTKQFHPDAQRGELSGLEREIEAVFIRIGEAYEVLMDPERRGRYETILGTSRQTPRAVPTAPAPPPQQQQPVAPRDADSEGRLADRILQDARKLLAEDKYWEAIQTLEAALELAKGGRINHSIRILLARATAKNPKWQKRAEGILLSVIEEEPANIEALFLLGTLYRSAGLKSRAIAQFRRVLEIEPRNTQAAAELRLLYAPPGDPSRPA